MSETTPQPTAKVIIELTSNGSIRMESYRNGQRQQIQLTRGQEWWEVLEELSIQRKAAQAQQERKQEKQAKESRARHNRVLADTAAKFGDGFAAKVIYGKHFVEQEPIPTGPKSNGEKKPGISTTPISDMIRVCHCGRTVEPFMEKCIGCPGHHGAGKIVKQAKAPHTPAILADDFL